jgi:C1A family cysteine protease
MRKLNLKPSPEDLRDYKFKAASFKSIIELPARVDLRDDTMPPIWDQGYLGSCTAHAIIALREYLFTNHAVKPGVSLSRLYLYYHSRDVQGWANKDDGAYLRDAFKVIYHRGVSLDHHWPYNPDKVYDEPPDQADAVAYAFRISEYRRILNIAEAKASIAEGYPVVIGMNLYSSFMSGHKGRIPVPDTSKESYVGAHAMLAVGYTETHFIVRNSFGTDWGDGGYCYIPYSLFYWPYTFEMWTCKADPRTDL